MLEKEKINFEKTIVVGIVTKEQDETKLNEYLDELEFLTFTAGGEVVKRFWQKLEKPHPKTFLGTGKIEEIHRYIVENEISSFIFYNIGVSLIQIRIIHFCLIINLTIGRYALCDPSISSDGRISSNDCISA
mgnify:CR=1 FL=1